MSHVLVSETAPVRIIELHKFKAKAKSRRLKETEGGWYRSEARSEAIESPFSCAYTHILNINYMHLYVAILFILECLFQLFKDFLHSYILKILAFRGWRDGSMV